MWSKNTKKKKVLSIYKYVGHVVGVSYASFLAFSHVSTGFKYSASETKRESSLFRSFN